MDKSYLHQHYGQFDDYGKLIEKDQFIFRPHFRSLDQFILDCHTGFPILVLPVIQESNMKYYLPDWMAYMHLYHHLFYQCVDKYRLKNMRRHKLGNLEWVVF